MDMSTSHFLAQAWNWNPAVLAACAGMIAAYQWAVGLRFSGKTAAWLGAVLLILLALVSPLDALSVYLFSVHMARHIVFVLVIPALLLLGLPAERVERWLRHPAAARAKRVVGKPALTWMAGIGAMTLWHVPAVFHAAAAHPALHMLEHLSLLMAGALFWWPLLSPVPRCRIQPVPQGIAYLASACLACTAMGVLITFAPATLYSAYAHPAAAPGMLRLLRNDWGISAAMDQQIGGLLMWVPCCLIYLAAIMAMFARWYSAEETAAPQHSEMEEVQST
jgi:putative membrane protein